MKSFTKLFSSITSSSIWRAPNHVRLVWITMLAMADRDGEVWASVGGLADQARVSRDECLDALRVLSGPDEDSRTKDNDGRRIEAIDGGWLLLNYAKYRAIGRSEDRREYFREHKRAQRSESRHSSEAPGDCPQCPPLSTNVSPFSPIAEAEAEAEKKRIHDRPTVAECPLFGRFWSGYGKKVGKAMALKAWAKLTQADRLAAADGVAAFILAKPDPQFRPDPVRYLTHRRWEDESTQGQPDQGGLCWESELPTAEEARRALGLSDG